MEQVTVSKIFPAGAGWQAASIVADAAGHQADSLAFAAYTGVGDGIAVAAGHTSYYAAKKAIVDPNINIGEQAGLGVWLGSAAVCSGRCGSRSSTPSRPLKNYRSTPSWARRWSAAAAPS